MNWETATRRLERVLGTRVRPLSMPIGEWNIAAHNMETGLLGKSVAFGSDTLFFMEADDDTVLLLAIERELQETERSLVELLLDTMKEEPSDAANEDNLHKETADGMRLLRDWLLDRLEQGQPYPVLPDEFRTLKELGTSKIPFLIQGDFADPGDRGTAELRMLLDSFFDTETTVIPLGDREWLLLGAMAILEESDAGDGGTEGEESVEESLASIGSGFLEMLDNEWVGECHLAVFRPIVPAESLVPTIAALREAIELGKAYHPGENVHFPWRLQLEKLLHDLPQDAKTGFVDKVFQAADSLDGDTTAALETFFAQNCSVSDTAKKLYIHRNTLLYRLDKFKQETGLDVRTFHDAVLVKIALLLYKVTKRA